MAIQSVIQVAELIVIPTRPSPHDLRAVGATVDLCDRAGKPLIFVVNGATPKARITSEAAVALSQHGTVAPVTIHHRTDFASSMIDGRTVMEVDPNSRSAGRGGRAVELCLGPAREEFPPHRLHRARRGGERIRRGTPGGRLRPPRRELRERMMFGTPKPTASLSSALLARKGPCPAGDAPAGVRLAGAVGAARGSRLERHGRGSDPAGGRSRARSRRPRLSRPRRCCASAPRSTSSSARRPSAPAPVPAPVPAPTPQRDRDAGRGGESQAHQSRIHGCGSIPTAICGCASHRRSVTVRRSNW